MDLLAIITENFSFSFCGRINVLNRKNKQFLGVIFQAEDMIVNAEYGELKGKKALATILMEMRSGKQFLCISEPEVISSEEISFRLNERQFEEFNNNYFNQFDRLQKLRPKDELKFILNANKVGITNKISKDEFDVMRCIVEYPFVKDIYKYCNLLDLDITNILISLRKKGMILVYK